MSSANNPFASFSQPSSPSKVEDAGDHDDLNHDDFEHELPDDMIPPEVDDLLRVTTDLDKQVKDTEDTPIAKETSDTDKRVSALDPGFDILSQHTELDESNERINELSTTVRTLESKVDKIVDTDILLRNLVTQVKELSTELSGLKSTLSALRSDFTQYQTLTSQTINDVERRAKMGQLVAAPAHDVTVKEPPASITVSRETVSSTDPPPAPVVQEPKFTVADLGDFF
jgi:outer membrane murein-binding lipoprotein Lpp